MTHEGLPFRLYLLYSIVEALLEIVLSGKP
jgi:hypothetical protein